MAGRCSSASRRILHAARRGLELVAAGVGAVHGLRRKELVHELVDDGAADAAADGFDLRDPVGVRRRVRERAAGEEVKADRTMPTPAGHAPRGARDFDLAAKPRIAHRLDDTNAIRRVAAIGDVDPQARERADDLGARHRLDRLQIGRGDEPVQVHGPKS